MRWLELVIVLPVAIVLSAIVLGNTVLQPPPAATRLSGVAVAIRGHRTSSLGDDRYSVRLDIRVTSFRDIDECLGFTLDQPFAQRRIDDPTGGCVMPRAAGVDVSLTYDRLTDDDLAFPSHTLVWGIPGGRCGLIFSAMGICVVEQAGTADFELPVRNPLPTFRGTFAPIPFYTFNP